MMKRYRADPMYSAPHKAGEYPMVEDERGQWVLYDKAIAEIMRRRDQIAVLTDQVERAEAMVSAARCYQSIERRLKEKAIQSRDAHIRYAAQLKQRYLKDKAEIERLERLERQTREARDLEKAVER